jgi:hypothetical protein
MKKLLIIVLLLAFSTSAFAAVLTSQWTEGLNRYCKYSDGVIITIMSYSLCPLSK